MTHLLYRHRASPITGVRAARFIVGCAAVRRVPGRLLVFFERHHRMRRWRVQVGRTSSHVGLRNKFSFVFIYLYCFILYYLMYDYILVFIRTQGTKLKFYLFVENA